MHRVAAMPLDVRKGSALPRSLRKFYEAAPHCTGGVALPGIRECKSGRAEPIRTSGGAAAERKLLKSPALRVRHSSDTSTDPRARLPYQVTSLLEKDYIRPSSWFAFSHDKAHDRN